MGSYWRYRVGDVRVICDIQEEELLILVIEVGHRREVYRTK
jgi:mRNA interferase RelE/StbE